MKRNILRFPLASEQVSNMKERMLNWADQFSILLLLDSNNYADKHGKYDFLLAAGAKEIFKPGDRADALTALQQFHDERKDWLFGHISYDIKNKLETKLSSAKEVKHGYSDLQFFIPAIVCYKERGKDELVIETIDTDPAEVYEQINNTSDKQAPGTQIQFTHKIEKEQYLNIINKLREHIADGDCYEINFCREGYCENADIDTLSVFKKLNTLSPAPFAAYYKSGIHAMMCASPERYLLKHADKLIAQPIKGTARRNSDATLDDQIKNELQQNIKERAENVMIVDLMRNDLARSCETGSVEVEELFGIYSFPQVHQMISTVSAKMRAGMAFTEAIRHSFPMGSMTGAPKIKVMQLIEQYEASRRELFSGSVGYITPEADFDFNVIIRSLFYNAESKYLSYQTGGAITYDSVAEMEWEEMRLKAWALERVFEQ